MLITSAEIQNYKSFDSPTSIDFVSGINIVTGKNNSGKTALLEALSAHLSAIHTLVPRLHQFEGFTQPFRQ